jgi:hypothetical protein
MKPKHFTINYTVYQFDLFVSIGESDKTIRNILQRKLPKDVHSDIDDVFLMNTSGNLLGRVYMFSTGQTIIRFLKKPTQGVIAHEALHAVELLMRTIGNKKVNEAWNYLLEYIVNEINKKIKCSSKPAK